MLKKNGQDAQRSKNLFSITHMSKAVQGTMSHNAFILGFIYLYNIMPPRSGSSMRTLVNESFSLLEDGEPPFIDDSG